MKFLKAFVVSLLLIASSLPGQQSSRGTVPRADVNGYAAHAGQDGLQIGASLLTHKEVKKTFASDLNQCCLVVEVAFYPVQKDFAKVVRDNFMLREEGKEIGAKPSGADVLAARLELRLQPANHEPAGVSTTSGIGYERSRSVDPGTGTTTSRSGIYEHQGVGVGIPIGGKPESPTVAAEESRRAIEAELKEKMLPEVNAWEPVAGYLYFSVPKKSRGGYELVYMVDDKKIVLPLK